MVSFSCEVCNDTIIKKKLDQHVQRCYGAYFTCIDCSRTFQGNDYKGHTSCISEAEKYEKALYKGPKKQQNKNQPKREQPVKAVNKASESVTSSDDSKAKDKAGKSAKSLGEFLKPNKKQNLYKIVKKASQENSQEIKEFLKTISIVRDERGNITIDTQKE